MCIELLYDFLLSRVMLCFEDFDMKTMVPCEGLALHPMLGFNMNL